jgi:UDP-N-acetylglucosamine acyltransferase
MIHPSAEVHETATIHPMARIDVFVTIGPLVTVGAYTIIGPGCMIGCPPELKGYPGPGFGVVIGEGCYLTKSVVVDSGTTAPTRIDDGAYLMSGSHVGHDAYIGKEVTMSPKAVVGGHCHIWAYAVMGIGSGTHQHTELPPGAMLGAGAFLTKKCQPEPFTIYIGNGQRLRENTKAIEAVGEEKERYWRGLWEEHKN